MPLRARKSAAEPCAPAPASLPADRGGAARAGWRGEAGAVSRNAEEAGTAEAETEGRDAKDRLQRGWAAVASISPSSRACRLAYTAFEETLQGVNGCKEISSTIN